MKNYVKPSVSFQFFNLEATTVGACVISSTHDPYVCPIRIPDNPGEFIFSVDPCTIDADPENFNMCYHGPNADLRILGS